MKKYLLGVFAVVLAVGFSAFTKSEAPKADKKQTNVHYLIYNSGAQGQVTSYTLSAVGAPAPSCPFAVRLCAIRIVDPNNDGVITQTEFAAVFNVLDGNSNGTLDDQTETTTLLKKS